MKEELFINIHNKHWEELEQLHVKVEQKGLKALPSPQVRRFLHLFRQISHHLAYVRTFYPKSSLEIYLNTLIAKCHNHVYAVKKVTPSDFYKFLILGFPTLLKECRIYILMSFLFFIAGVLIGFLPVLYDPSNANLFLPNNLIDAMKNNQIGAKSWDYPLMSSIIMANNIAVSLKAFVFGITAGVGTIFVLMQNGMLLGALASIVFQYNDAVKFWSLILPHGIIELTAIFISGGAGLMITKGLLIPGELSRKHALIFYSKKSVSLVLGSAFMLVIAGVIEG